MNHLNKVTPWVRICPKCGGKVYHQSKKDRDRREREGRTCGGKANLDCKIISKAQRKLLSKKLIGKVYEKRNKVNRVGKPKWTRRCPNCNVLMKYYGTIEHFRHAVKNNTVCNKCAVILSENTFADQMKKDPNKVKKMRATKAGFKSWEEYKKKYPKWKQYKAKVWSETYKQLKRNPPLKNFHRRGKCGVKGAYQIDHIIGVRYGFDHHISPKKVGAYSNLRMIPWKNNRLKG